MALESGREAPKSTEAIRESEETRLFSLEKPSASPDAKRVLLTFDNPGAYNALSPVVEALMHDERCKGISIITSGWGLGQFTKDERFRKFEEVHSPSDEEHPAHGTVLAEMLQESAAYQPDVVLASTSAKNGPESVAIFGGKANFGASKLFLFIDGWGSWPDLGSQINRAERNASQIDGVFCCDEIAKRLAMRTFPDIPSQKFLAGGSPAIDALYVDDSESFTNAARMKLGLSGDALAVLYAGDVSGEYGPGIDGLNIDTRSLDATFDAMNKAARDDPKKHFVLLVRPHPRNTKEYTDMQLGRALAMQTPPNMEVRGASYPDVSIQEARYAADAVASIVSTENFLMLRIGRPAFALALQEPGMGDILIKHLYGDVVKDMQSAEPLLSFVHTSEEFAEALASLRRAPAHIEKPSAVGGSAQFILDGMLSSR